MGCYVRGERAKKIPRWTSEEDLGFDQCGRTSSFPNPASPAVASSTSRCDRRLVRLHCSSQSKFVRVLRSPGSTLHHHLETYAALQVFSSRTQYHHIGVLPYQPLQRAEYPLPLRLPRRQLEPNSRWSRLALPTPSDATQSPRPPSLTKISAWTTARRSTSIIGGTGGRWEGGRRGRGNRLLEVPLAGRVEY